MQIGDLVRETTQMDRKCSLGVVLKVGIGNDDDAREEYYVHFFDDNDKCWMGGKWLEVLNESR